MTSVSVPSVAVTSGTQPETALAAILRLRRDGRAGTLDALEPQLP